MFPILSAAAALAPRLLSTEALRSPLDAVALNPQPLPPKETAAAQSLSPRALDDDWCGTVPKRFPPPPPPPPWTEQIDQLVNLPQLNERFGAAIGRQI